MTEAGLLIVIDVLTPPTSIPLNKIRMSSRDDTATPHVPNSPFASGSSVSYPYRVGISKATLRPVSPWAMRYLNRRFVSSGRPNPANIRIVHSRPRYMVGWIPRVNGKPPGLPSRSSGFPATSSGVYNRFTGRPEVVMNSLRRSGSASSASRRVVSCHRFNSSSRTFRPSSSRMNALRPFNWSDAIRRLRRSLGGARLDDRLGEPLEGLLDVLAGLRGRVEDRALVRKQRGRSLLRGHFAAVGEVRLVSERVHRNGSHGVANPVDPLRQVSERLGAGHVEHREDAFRSVEVGLLEQLEERALAHDIEDHHVDLDGPALHRAQCDRLLRDDGPEGPDVGLVERAGHEPVDEARLADAFLPDEADLEFEGLRLRVHRGPSHHLGVVAGKGVIKPSTRFSESKTDRLESVDVRDRPGTGLPRPELGPHRQTRARPGGGDQEPVEEAPPDSFEDDEPPDLGVGELRAGPIFVCDRDRRQLSRLGYVEVLREFREAVFAEHPRWEVVEVAARTPGGEDPALVAERDKESLPRDARGVDVICLDVALPVAEPPGVRRPVEERHDSPSPRGRKPRMSRTLPRRSSFGFHTAFTRMPIRISSFVIPPK